MDCASCKRSNRPGARFCAGCGGSLAPRCPACNAETAPDAQFCDACGASLAAAAPAPGDSTGTRKVVTILFADLVGSTSLQERLDAESTRRVMERFYAAMRGPVEAHGGAVVQLLGDGVMCVFGVPHVAEDDAIRAVRAAVGMQQAFREFAREEGAIVGERGLRIAVNTGEVVTSDERPQGIGDPLNVAGRLQQEAREGDVLIGEATRRLVADQVTLAHFGTFALKGRAEAVPAYRVVSLERPAGAPAVGFVGRDEELRRLTSVYEAAVAEPGPRLAAILGSPGLGKSRLLGEFARRLGERAIVLTARCDPAGGATFAPLADALRGALKIDDGASGEPLRAAIASALPAAEPERARIAAGVAALLAGAPAAPEETFFVVRRLLASLAQAQPVVLALDDLQWAEPLLLDLTEHLVQWSGGVPLLVLVAARPELRDTRSSLAAPGGLVADVVTLAGLDAGAATRLAANVIGADELPAAIAGRVLATSEGNPLFVGELVRMLVHDGALKREGDRWTTSIALADIEMPPTIHALLAARIERLRPEERTILERAAVIGRQFSRAALAQLLPRELGDLDARLESLRRSELVEPDTGWFLGEPALRFHHALIRDAAYRRVLRGTRAELHGRFADWITARVGEAIEHDETIGWHLEQAHQQLRELGPVDARGRALGERAARYLAAAGRRALARDDVPVAGSLLGRALAQLDPADPARADLALDWCEALLAAGEVGPAAGALAELARFTADSGRLRAWHTCFAGQLAVLTDPQSLRATADAVAAAAEALAQAGDTAGEAKAHSVHALALQRLGKGGACEAALDRALAAARRAHDRRLANTVLAGAPLAALWGPSPVTRASGRCLDVVRVLRITQGAPAVEAVALRCQAVLEALRGRGDAASRMISSARRMVEELGLTQQLLETDVFSGHIDLLEGDPVSAERVLRGAYDGLREHGLGIDAARAAALLARALLAQGRAAEAETLSAESEALAGDDLQAAIAWRGVRAEALARRGEHALAVEFARAAVEIAAGTDALLHHADARLALAAALRAADCTAEADTEERRAIELWETKGATMLAERARRELLSAPPAAVARRDRAPSPAPAPARPKVRANAATAHAARLDAIVAARDADALSDLLSDSVQIVHHPTRTELGPEGALSMLTGLLRAENLSFSNELLATLGDSLVLSYVHSSLTALAGDDIAPFGAIDGDHVAVMEVDGAGRQRRAELFPVDRLGDAVARLYELHAALQPDGPARAGAEATARSVAAVLGVAGDSSAFRAVLAPGLEFVDHKQLGFGRSRGADAVRRGNLVLHEVADNVTTRLDELLALRSDGLVARRTFRGTDRAGGGEFERDLVELWCFDGDGLLLHLEHFDCADTGEALVRFEELVADAPPAARRRVRPNAATANAARTEAAVAARDFEAFKSVFGEYARSVDHPNGLTYEESASLASYEWLFRAKDVVMRHYPLATLGDSLALFHATVSFRSLPDSVQLGPFGAVETELILMIEVDAAGRRRLSEVFALDHLGDGVARLYERHAELAPEGAERARAAAIARALAMQLAPFEAARWAGTVSPGIEFVDHRPVGLGTTRGSEAFLRGIGSLLAIARDVTNRVDEIVGARSDALLLRITNLGTDRASGGPYERPLFALRIFGADGLLSRLEFFGPERGDDARARFEELTVPPPVRRVRPNAATGNAARTEAAVGARDFEAFKRVFRDDAQNVHHPTGTTFAESSSLDSYERLLRAEGVVMRHEPLATLGDSLALFRALVSFRSLPDSDHLGPFGAVDTEMMMMIEVDEAGQRRLSEIFAPDRLADATARLYQRYAELLPSGPERARAEATARTIQALPLQGPFDPDRYATALAADVESLDHRVVGVGAVRGAEVVQRVHRALRDLSDSVDHFEDILGLHPDGLLARRTNSGTDRASGGRFDRPLINLWVFGADGRVARVEQFDASQAELALARFDELAAQAKPAPRRVRPNAATANAARADAAILARDADAIQTVFAEHAEIVHHPTGAVYDEQGSLRNWRSLFEATDLRFATEALATLGDSLALCRTRMSFAEIVAPESDFIGATAKDDYLLIEVDARGRRTRAEFFALDRLGDAVVRMYERYAETLPPGPARERATVSARLATHLLSPFDTDYSAVFARDLVFADHRPLGLGSLSGPEEFIRWNRSMIEMSEHLSIRYDDVLGARPDMLLVSTVVRGTVRASGASFELPIVHLFRTGADGKATRVEWFEPAQIDEALAGFDAFSAERPESERRVRPNAATENAARHDAAIAARDVDAISSFIRDDLESVHHPTGTRYGKEGALARLRGSLRAESPTSLHRPLATLGDSLALCHFTASGQSGTRFDVGAWDFAAINLIEVDAEGRRSRLETFDESRLADALPRLYERYAELIPDGPTRARAVATAQSVDRWLRSLGDPERFAAAVAPGVEFVDHRSIGMGSARGAEAVLRGHRAGFELASHTVFRIEDVLALRSDAFLLRTTTLGTDRASGGAFERPLLLLGTFGSEGLVTRIEWFDPSRDAEALARFDELTAEPKGVERRVRPNAATANAARFDAAVAARDAGAFGRLLADRVESIDHTTGLEYDREGAIDYWRSLLGSEDLAFRNEPLATLGDSLALCAVSVSSSRTVSRGVDVGAIDWRNLVLVEVDAEGRRCRAEVFPPARLGDAISRLYERYAELLPEGPMRAHAAATARSVESLGGLLTPDLVAGNVDPGVELVDHRPAGFGALHGAQALTRAIATAFEVADGLSERCAEVLAALPDTLLSSWVTSGRMRDGGGEVEWPHLRLCRVGPDGRFTRIETFAADEVREALARFDELVAAPRPARFANAAWRAVEKFERAWRERDWDGAMARLDPALVLDDRRALARLQISGEEFLANQRFIFAMKASRYQSELLATRGERLSLSRTRLTGEPKGGGDILVELLTLVEIDDLGRYVALVVFDPDDLDAAYGELDLRYAAGEGAVFGPRLAKLVAAIAARDWQDVTAQLAADFVLLDHRAVGWETLRGPAAWVDTLRSLVELAPDARLRIDHFRSTGRGALLESVWVGTREGGSFEIPKLIVSEVDHASRFHRFDTFDPERLDAALARYGDLASESRAPLIENLATRAAAAGTDAMNGRDWDRFTAAYQPEFRSSDRRRMVQLELDRAQHLELMRAVFEIGQDTELELLATRGSRLALFHLSWLASDGSVGPSDGEFLMILEVDDAGGTTGLVAFDVDALAAAFSELDRRYAAGEAAPYAEIWEQFRLRTRAVATRDWDWLESLLPADLVTEDHRPTRWGILTSRDEYLAMFRALEDLAPDVSARLEHVLGLDGRGVLAIMNRWGTQDGGAFEMPVVTVNDVGPDGRVKHLHLYDLEQLDDARARFETLRR